MAKFRYRMQSILDIKLKMETMAKQDLANARNALDEEEEKLLALRKRKEEYEIRQRQLLSGKLDFLEIAEGEQAIQRMEEFILKQMTEVSKAEAFLEQKRQALEEVIKERKVQESLRQKAFEEFWEEEKAAESKEIDQLTSFTYGERIKSEQNNEEES